MKDRKLQRWDGGISFTHWVYYQFPSYLKILGYVVKTGLAFYFFQFLCEHYYGIFMPCGEDVSCYSLFPLLFEAQEYPIKVLLLLVHSILMWSGFSVQLYEGPATTASTAHIKGRVDHFESEHRWSGPTWTGHFVLGWVEKSYLAGLAVTEIWVQLFHPLLLGDKFPFIPQMSISIYCTFGITYCWIWQLTSIIQSHRL